MLIRLCRSESVFKGWQLLCVLLVTFPPSKNFEPSLRSFIYKAKTQSEGRVDIMAKYCLRRLAYISRKGPRGKAPTTAEIEAASVSAGVISIRTLDLMPMLLGRCVPSVNIWRIARRHFQAPRT